MPAMRVRRAVNGLWLGAAAGVGPSAVSARISPSSDSNRSLNADSGVFIRAPQLQCRDYLLAGPYKELKNYKPQDWNELVITVKDGVAHCTCNGEVLEAAYKLPETGPIGLEGDSGQLEYRRIRLSKRP